ncbi:hypothetical protein GN244_ATG05260 [Phytophthora infestans]|uniref:Uncharacterized protein n=1 Tax=Phytophthora infestans TaxID=4787 RepID=A0A833S7Q1_PHYIN|nr:hypothetical protein GN244_ATG05260 [Phytophthora infestans]
MPGLSLEEPPSEELCAGDLIEYYSCRFVCGDSRGLLESVVLAVDDSPDNLLPVSLDTGEALPLSNFMRRRRDSAGNDLSIEEVKWRKLRTYKLKPRKVRHPTQASALRKALSAAVDAVREDLRSESAETSYRHSLRGGEINLARSNRLSNHETAPALWKLSSIRKRNVEQLQKVVKSTLYARNFKLDLVDPTYSQIDEIFGGDDAAVSPASHTTCKEGLELEKTVLTGI